MVDMLPLRYVVERETSPGVWEVYRMHKRRERAHDMARQGQAWDHLRGIGPRRYRIRRRRVQL